MLFRSERMELAWYAMQRIPVRDTQEEVLNDWLCVNKQGKQLQMTAYRKLLERASAELRFKENYNVGYLHALYGYLAIAFGRKTVHEMAKEYLKSHTEITLYDCYSDLGATGTNFQRSDFERLMQDVRDGLINCIIVKDFSRFGRNYIETGNFVEKIFPFLGDRKSVV